MDLNLVRATNSASNLPTGRTDWFYRNLVPKSLKANLVFRKAVLDLCATNEQYREEIKEICRRDILFYISVFGWTVNPRLAIKKIPFLPYGYQETAIYELWKAVGNEDIAVPKTRDMGASWMCLIVLEWFWHFCPLNLFLLTSAKKELVDGPSDKALFRKLDFWWDNLPSWMMPEKKRIDMHCKNLENGSCFDGEATIENMGTGDRRTAILLDETSKMPEAKKIFTSTRDVTACRIFNSTPNGRYGTGEAFYERILNRATKKLFLHWSEHPTKRVGLYKMVKGIKVLLGPDYDWRKDYDFDALSFKDPEEKPRSTWYDKECDRAGSPKEIAQELDIDFLGSSERFADTQSMVRVKSEHCQVPHRIGELITDDTGLDAGWMSAANGKFELYLPLDQYGKPPLGDFAIGADVAAGTGGQFSSESGLVVWNRKTREQVALWASSRVKPEPFGVFAVAVCRWFHGAVLVPEVNGPLGTTFINSVRETGYSNLYLREVQDDISKTVLKKVGYFNRDGGAEILGQLQADMVNGSCKVRSARIIQQFLEYEWRGGKLVHASSETSDSESDKGKTHGDVAIAAAVGYLAVKGYSRLSEEEQEDSEYELGTYGWRQQQYDERDALVAEMRENPFRFGRYNDD